MSAGRKSKGIQFQVIFGLVIGLAVVAIFLFVFGSRLGITQQQLDDESCKRHLTTMCTEFYLLNRGEPARERYVEKGCDNIIKVSDLNPDTTLKDVCKAVVPGIS